MDRNRVIFCMELTGTTSRIKASVANLRVKTIKEHGSHSGIDMETIEQEILEYCTSFFMGYYTEEEIEWMIKVVEIAKETGLAEKWKQVSLLIISQLAEKFDNALKMSKRCPRQLLT